MPGTRPDTAPSTSLIRAKALCAMTSGMPRNRARRVEATAFWAGASSLRRLKNTVPSVPTIGRPPPDFSFVRVTGFSVPFIAFAAPPDTSSVRTNVAALRRLAVGFADRT